MYKFNVSENEVVITGCHDCPFLHYHERKYEHNPYCCLDRSIDVWEDIFSEKDPLKKEIPEVCKLRNSNFKLTRIL